VTWMGARGNGVVWVLGLLGLSVMCQFKLSERSSWGLSSVFDGRPNVLFRLLLSWILVWMREEKNID